MKKTRCLALVLHRCKTCSFTLKEERRLRLSKNGVMKIFGLMRKVVVWDWRRLHDRELYDLNCRKNIIWGIKSKRMLWPGHVAHWERGKIRIGFGGGGAEGKRPPGRPCCRLANNTKMYLQQIKWSHERYWSSSG